MKVLILSPYYWPAMEWGGVVSSVHRTARALHMHGLDVHVITTTVLPNGTHVKGVLGTRVVEGVTVTYQRSIGPTRYFFAPQLIGRMALLAPHFDVVHIQGIWTFQSVAGSQAARWFGKPLILSPRGSLKNHAIGLKARKKRLYMRFVEQRAIRSATMLHLTSENERRELPRPFQTIPAAVVPNIVDCTEFRPRRDVPLVEGQPSLVMSGRIHEIKGFNIIMPALAAVRRRYPGVMLYVAGGDEGGYRRKVDEMMVRFGVQDNVTFLGHLERRALIELLCGSDLCVMPSYQENFGNAAAEAMALEVPVVVSDRVDIASDIETAGAGRVVDLDSDAFAGAICELACKEGVRLRMGRSGRKLVEERYSGESVSRGLAALYQRAVNMAPHAS